MSKSSISTSRRAHQLLMACVLAASSTQVLAVNALSGLSGVEYDKLKTAYDTFKVGNNTFAWRVFSGAGTSASLFNAPNAGMLYSVAFDDWVARSDQGSFLYVPAGGVPGGGGLIGETSSRVNARSAIGTNQGNISTTSTTVPVNTWTNTGAYVQGIFETSFTDVIRPTGGLGGRFSLGAHADAILPKYATGQSQYSFSFGWTIFGSNGVSKIGGGAMSGSWGNNGYLSKFESCTNCSLTQSAMSASGFVRADFSFLMNLAPGDYVRVYSEIRGYTNFSAAGQNASAFLDAGSTAHIDAIQSLDATALEAASGALVYQDGAWRYPMPTTAVPEPASLAMMLMGLASVLGVRRQKACPA